MDTVNIHEAKTHLSRLLEKVSRGEDVIIANNGTPVARLTQLARTEKPREPGGLKGQIDIKPDFDAPLPDELGQAFGHSP